MGEEGQPTPAQPILASNLLESEEKQRRRFADKGERISSACAVLDESVLGEGGVERGIVLGISADGLEGRLLSLNLIVSVLLSDTQTSGPKSPQVAIIDTTGSFPISLLARVIRSRILQAAADPTLKSATTANSTSTNYGQIDKENLLNEVQKYLEQVTISRVFDVEGLWEVLSEVTLESPSSLPQRDGKTIAADLMQRSTSSFPITLRTSEEPSTVEEIIDSEDENLTPDDNYGATAKQPADQGHEGIQILVVDNMGDLINELLARKEKTDAHNQLGALSTFIYNLSSYSNILTILHNSTISSNPPHSSNADARPSSRHQPQLSSITLSSIFNSNPLKPALGRIFDQFPSLHVMLSPMPKARGDAELLYGEDDDTRPKSGIEYCTILEVLKDETPNLGHGRSSSRFGARERQWVGLVISNEGIGLRHAFGEEDGKF